MRREKRPLTLLEIMIVIFLIGLIGSVIGYSMKGSLDEGKAFKTKQAAEQVHDILILEIAEGFDRDQVIQNPKKFLVRSGVAKNPDKLLKDGWGNDFEIAAHGKNDLKVISKSLIAYERKKNKNVPGKISASEDSELCEEEEM